MAYIEGVSLQQERSRLRDSTNVLCPSGSIVTIDANRTIKDAIQIAAVARRPRQRISVTDLLYPMQAYFQRTRPDITPSPEKHQLMLMGTGFHELFGAAVSSEEYLEQFVEMDGIVGKIDVYEDHPLELKTSGRLPEDLAYQNPSYVDQLGMYCAMVHDTEGSIVVYRRTEYGRDPGLRSFAIRFRDLGGISDQMRIRRDVLRQALDAQNPSDLPKCDWWNRRCDYQSVCDCGAASAGGQMVAAGTVEVREDNEMNQRLLMALNAAPGRQTTKLILNDIVFPRRALAGMAAAAGDEDEAVAEPNLRDLQRGGFQLALTDAIRYGEPGAYRGIPVSLGPMKAIVRAHHDIPCIFRPTGTRSMIERDRLVYERPYYFERLALEAALTRTDRARLVIYYSSIPDDKFMVYDIGFRNADATLAEAERRRQLLESGAVRDGFPPCGPDWMPGYCYLKERCLCR